MMHTDDLLSSRRGSLLAGLVCGFVLSGGCARGTEANLNPGAGPPGDGGDPVEPPPGPTDFAPLAGLVSAAAGPGMARIDWRLPRESDTKTFGLALFMSNDRRTVYDAAPFAAPLSGTSLLLSSLADGERLFFGLGIRETENTGMGDPGMGDPSMGDPVFSGAAAYERTGGILSVTPGPVVYVDAEAEATGANGMTPETAFPDPRLAILVAGFQLNGGNVWLKAGDYENVGFVAQGSGIHVYGGFDETYDLATRDTTPGTTVLNGAPDGTGTPTLMIEMQALASIPILDPIAIVDGLTFAGNGQTFRGIEITNTAAEFRAVDFSGFRGSGLRMQNSDNVEYDVVVTGSNFSGNIGEGLDGDGPFDLIIDGCVFNSNGTEGLDLDDWIAPPGESVTLRVTGSRFFGNGSEGLDVDLNVPLGVLDLSGGTFSIEIHGCSFERNRLDGCLIDIEYDFFPQWDTKIIIRESLARANGMVGFQLDLDGPSSAILHRVVAAGNGAGGIVIGSESVPGTSIVSSSVAVGNQGPGIQAINPIIGIGNRSLVVTHCVVAGNAGAGIASENKLIMASSTISHLQEVNGIETEFRASHLSNSASENLFINAASGFATIVGVTKEGTLMLSGDAAPFDAGTTVEVADDGDALLVTNVDGPGVQVDPAAALVIAPDLFSYFSGEDVVEDYRLVQGSAAEGTGLAGAGGIVDSGVFGSPVPGVPGFAAEAKKELFHVLTVTPAPSLPLAPTTAIEIAFSELLEPSSINDMTVRVLTDAGAEVSETLDGFGETLVLAPPMGGWPNGVLWVEILGGVRSDRGIQNAAPLALRFQVN